MKKIFITLLFLTSASIQANSIETVSSQVVDTACCTAQPTKNVMLHNALKMIGTPYVAATLEVNAPQEKLVANLKEVDCTTYVEYVLAQSLCTVPGDSAQFLANLQRIRYRDGIIADYTSRLHYITEWIMNGVKYDFLTDISEKYCKYTIPVNLSFMTTHYQLYRQLASSPENRTIMRNYEEKLSGQVVHYVPKSILPVKGFKWIHPGDIITIVTNKEGLDIAHLGIAVYQNGELHLLNASSIDRKVEISKEPFCRMLESSKTWLGFRVVRMKK